MNDSTILPKIPPELAHLGLKQIFYCGNLELLQKRKITIIGSRNPNPYTQHFTQTLARKLAQKGAVIVSGEHLERILSRTNILCHTQL